jgi:putative ABC transport system ATP-binding protein
MCDDVTLRARQVRLAYGSTVALDGADLAIRAGEVVALVGPSGSGKSSLLYCLAGLLAPDSGEIILGATSLVGLSEDASAQLRRSSMGFVFQFGELVPELSLHENIELPLRLLGRSRRAARRSAAEYVERLGIADVAERRPDEVSGGQAQRAAVARAVIHRPRVVFADEPTGALDTANGATVLATLLELAREHDGSVVLVTHDDGVARVADRRVVLRDGRTDQPAA